MESKIDIQITKQEERLKKLKAQQQAAKARENKKISEKQKKDDTRRKILIGSLILKGMQNDEIYNAEIRNKLNTYLTETRDRELFNL